MDHLRVFKSVILSFVCALTRKLYNRHVALLKHGMYQMLIEKGYATTPDFMWLYGKWSKNSNISGWNGFMEIVTKDMDFQGSKIIFLPFIRAPATNYNTIVTAIEEARQRTAAHLQETCIITFDQPLYMKARDVVESGQHPEFKNVVVRLGGFHLLMSFLGCIGTIMAGSGLKELLTTVYAENSVDQMLSGHAYSRAVRAHILTNLVLGNLIMNEVEFTPQEKAEMDSILLEEVVLSAEENEIVQNLRARFSSVLETAEQRGPTSKLWAQYYRMTTLMKRYIQAERMGDWELHLECVIMMLPFFHAAGHHNYAKSARLYIQDMQTLKERMTQREFNMFTRGGFTIRRSDKLWSGLWSDLTIEQVLMRALKSQGGLSHGRGISSSVLARFSEGMVYMLNICNEVERFSRTTFITSEQHKDMKPGRVERDNADAEKLENWFNVHPPFSPNVKLISISSGVIAGPDVNCHLAHELGSEGVKQIVGATFGTVTIKRKDRVTSLASHSSSVKVMNRQVNVEPLTIFQRVCITKRSDEQLKQHFKFELAPYPLALFTEEGMRKGNKSSFYAAFDPVSNNISLNQLCGNIIVIDGGYLLQKVIWHPNNSIQAIITGYTSFVINHFGSNVSIVFDGYPDNAAQKSTKSAERSRRYQSLTGSILFERHTIIKTPQEKFLSNESNKERLIKMLIDELQSHRVEAKQAEEDADVLIVETAISKSQAFTNVIILGEDIDLLCILHGLGATCANVRLHKSGRGGSDHTQYSSTSFDSGIDGLPPAMVLFLHAFSGCDTTCALFGQGKLKFIRVLKQNPDLVHQLEVFLQPNSLPEKIESAGEAFLIALYAGNGQEDLNTLRYSLFVRASASNKINLARLPPTKDAAKFHSFRTYHQIQEWLGVHKAPTDWGWHQQDSGLMPTTTSLPPAPELLLRSLSCKCKKGCTRSCSCRKAGMKCSTMCKYCKGSQCTNVPPIEDVEEGEDDLDDAIAHVCNDDAIREFDVSPGIQMGINLPNNINEVVEVDIDTPGPSKKTRRLI